MVCGALHAAVVVAIEVARRAIAPMSAHAAGGRQAMADALLRMHWEEHDVSDEFIEWADDVLPQWDPS